MNSCATLILLSERSCQNIPVNIPKISKHSLQIIPNIKTLEYTVYILLFWPYFRFLVHDL